MTVTCIWWYYKHNIYLQQQFLSSNVNLNTLIYPDLGKVWLDFHHNEMNFLIWVQLAKTTNLHCKPHYMSISWHINCPSKQLPLPKNPLFINKEFFPTWHVFWANLSTSGDAVFKSKSGLIFFFSTEIGKYHYCCPFAINSLGQAKTIQGHLIQRSMKTKSHL